jgi:hypothetical protein
MGLEQTLKELAAQRKDYSKYCAYQMLVDKLAEKDRAALEAAWERGMSANVIVKALRAEGYKTTAETIRSHRNGLCKCPKN